MGLKRKEQKKKNRIQTFSTIFPRSSDLFCIVTYYIKWFTTSWSHSIAMNAYFKGLILTNETLVIE